MLGDVGFAIFDGFLFRVIRNDSTPIVHPEDESERDAAGAAGGAGVASVAGAGGHLEDSMPRVRGDSVGVTPILRHDRLVFLNNLGIIPE